MHRTEEACEDSTGVHPRGNTLAGPRCLRPKNPDCGFVVFGNPLGLLALQGDLLSQMASRVTGADKLAKVRGDRRKFTVLVEAKLDPHRFPWQ